MEDHDEHQSENSGESERVTERVRIIGAETAAVLAAEQAAPAAASDEHTPGGQPELDLEIPAAPATEPEPPPSTLEGDSLAAVHPELPHWSDPPTGQVPAVIDRRSDEVEDAAWAAFADSGPVWREHQHEWEDTGGFEPSMLADDETRVGALTESEPVEERRPWEFDDLNPQGPSDGPAPGVVDEQTAETVLDRPQGEAPAEGDTGAEPEETAAVSEDDESEPAPGEAVTAVSDGEPTISAPSGPPPDVPEQRTRPRRYDDMIRRGQGAAERGGGRRNVPVAVATGVVVAAVTLGCFAAGPLATVVLATVVATLAAAEAFAALRRAALHPATLLGLVATVALMVSAYNKGVAALPLVGAIMVAATMVWYLVGAERGSPVAGISSTLMAFCWVGVLGSFAALILSPSIYPHRHGVAFLIGAAVATVATDVGALTVGSWLGRHQLAPHVSPNKTWEGWVGGAVLSVLASVLITGQVTPWTPAKAAILGVVVAVVAPLGDLCESLVKRDLGIKDMGSLLPGHGGVLDRMDALLFVLPATYYLVRVLHLG